MKILYIHNAFFSNSKNKNLYTTYLILIVSPIITFFLNSYGIELKISVPDSLQKTVQKIYWCI